MKHIQLFEEFVNETINEALKETELSNNDVSLIFAKIADIIKSDPKKYASYKGDFLANPNTKMFNIDSIRAKSDSLWVDIFNTSTKKWDCTITIPYNIKRQAFTDQRIDVLQYDWPSYTKIQKMYKTIVYRNSQLSEEFVNESTKKIDDIILSLKKAHDFDDIYVDSGFRPGDEPVIMGNTYDSITVQDINKILSGVNAKGDVRVTKQKSVQTKDGYWDVSIKNIEFKK